MSQQHIAWNSAEFEFVRHEAGTESPQFSMSHRPGVHYTCKLSPLQHEPMSAWRAPACVLSQQLAPDTHTRRGLYSLHVPSTCPLVCADVDDIWLLYSKVTDSAVEQAKRLLTSTGPVPQSHLKPISSPTATALPSDLELKESEDAWNNTRENNLR